jgi:hypothetical protein
MSNQLNILFYETAGTKTSMGVFYEDETFWLSQKKMAELFGVEVNTINYHIKEIFKSGELEESSTVRKIRIVQNEGKREVSREIEMYNLDTIIAVGYRVNSKQATHFRIWATNTLKEFIIKGFVMDDERLKQGEQFGKDYFEELLERIREIRASERRFYQKITDIYAQCSLDYDSNAPVTQKFYKTVQNKLHWAITGNTAAELVAVAKNYLSKAEIDELNRIVVMYLDYAENQAQRKVPMTMEHWAGKLDAFLQFNEYKVLDNAGEISHTIAQELAEKEYNKFRVNQDQKFVSDFDKAVEQLKKKK